MGINYSTGGQQSHPGFTPCTKQSYSFYSSNNTSATVDFSNVPADCPAILVTFYNGTDNNDHIDWHMGRSVNSGASWQSGANNPGWSDGWGDCLQTSTGNVGGYSFWCGTHVIPVTSNGAFTINNAGCSGQGNRMTMALIGYFGGDN